MTDALVDLLPWSLSGDPRDQRLYVLALASLGVGTLMCLVALRVAVLDVLAVALAAAGGAAWLLSTAPREGRTLLVVFPGNGLTLADLAVVPAAVLVVVLCWRRVRGR